MYTFMDKFAVLFAGLKMAIEWSIFVILLEHSSITDQQIITIGMIVYQFVSVIIVIAMYNRIAKGKL